MTRLIVVVGADRRQGMSVIETLLESSDEWRIRGIIVDLTSFDTQVKCLKRRKPFDDHQNSPRPRFEF
jgi:hypothetical protein